jgi:hypothetical protein
MSGVNLPQINDPLQMLATEFAGKAKSKREIFMFLTTECRVYLPQYGSISIYFLKDIISG